MTLTQTVPEAQAQPEAQTQPETPNQTEAQPQAPAQIHASIPPKISQRDLRLHSREIMDALEKGQTFVITRNGREIGEFVPAGHRRTFVPVDELIESARMLPDIDADKFRADMDAILDPYVSDPWARCAND